MKIISAKDYQALSRAAANIISAQVILKPSCVLGLATGSSWMSSVLSVENTMESTYKALREGPYGRTVNLDEYVGLDKDHDQSYAYFMRTNLFDHINVDPANTNIPDGMAPDEAEECARYDKVIHDLGGIDLQLLGIGNEQHTQDERIESLVARKVDGIIIVPAAGVDLAPLTLTGAASNLVPVTLGNILGGAGLALLLWYCHLKQGGTPS